LAVERAEGDALRHAIACGVALLAMKALVPAGTWQAHCRNHTNISERSVRVYKQLAGARVELEERQSSAGPFSIAGALRYLNNRKGSGKKSSQKAKVRTTLSSAVWAAATPAERQAFLADVGLLSFLAAIPNPWRAEIERRVARSPRGKDDSLLKQSEVLRRALGLIKIATTPGTSPAVVISNEKEAITALGKLNVLLTGVDIDEITIVQRYAKERRYAA
jgi:hypothetical protein